MTSGWDTYNRAAEAYRSVRPAYPTEVFDCIERYADLRGSPHVLEIGVGTGQATRQMAARGWRVLGLEPGLELAERARSVLAGFSGVEVRSTRFEDADLTDGDFDLVSAATAWHWVNPVFGIPAAARLLRPDGAIALWWNAHVTDAGDRRWAPIRRVYEEVAPELADLAPLTPDRHNYDPAGELAATGLFDEVQQHSYPFTVDYTSDEFLTLIATYASHRRLTDETQAQLQRGLRNVIDRELDRVVTKPYNCLVILGRPTKRLRPPRP